MHRDFIRWVGPFPSNIDDFPEEKKSLGMAIALFKRKGTKFHLELASFKGSRRKELWLWRGRDGLKVGDDGKRQGEMRERLGHKQTAKMPVVDRRRK